MRDKSTDDTDDMRNPDVARALRLEEYDRRQQEDKAISHPAQRPRDALLARARQFVADSGCDEDDNEVNAARDELLADMDAALPSTGLPAPAPHAEVHAMLANAIRSGELELVFCHPTGKFPALGASQEQRNIVEAALRSPAPHAEVREATIEECAKIADIHAFSARQAVRHATGPKLRQRALAVEDAALQIVKSIRNLAAPQQDRGGK